MLYVELKTNLRIYCVDGELAWFLAARAAKEPPPPPPGSSCPLGDSLAILMTYKILSGSGIQQSPVRT